MNNRKTEIIGWTKYATIKKVMNTELQFVQNSLLFGKIILNCCRLKILLIKTKARVWMFKLIKILYLFKQVSTGIQKLSCSYQNSILYIFTGLFGGIQFLLNTAIDDYLPNIESNSVNEGFFVQVSYSSDPSRENNWIAGWWRH